MSLNIRDLETEHLALEVAALTGDSKTGAVRQSLRERRDRLRREASREGETPVRFPEAEVRLRISARGLDRPPG